MQKCLDLIYTRAGEVPAVYDFSLTVNPGEAIGIVGESRCGKSTVALAIMQYMGKNGAVTAGEIRFLGRDMRTMFEEERSNFMADQSTISAIYACLRHLEVILAAGRAAPACFSAKAPRRVFHEEV
jgi:ABC-type glutathione transport system ATPase component